MSRHYFARSCDGVADNMRVVSLFAGEPRTVVGPGTGAMAEPYESAILKGRLEGPVAVGRQGIYGDGVSDRVHHGGPDKAVCVYPSAHYARWADELGPDAPAADGAFGENLTVAGVTEVDVAIGDRFQAPSGLVLEVSQPRVPCWKLARRWGIVDFPARVIDTGRTGWYCRVVHAGAVLDQDAFERVDHPLPHWTIARVNQVYHDVAGNPDAALALAEVPVLSATSRSGLYRRLDRAGYTPLACSVHDRLEDAAVRRVPLDFQLRTLSGASEAHRAYVRDLRTEEGAEYMELSSGRLVRLDRVERVASVD